MGVDEGNLLLIVMDVERYILTSSSYGLQYCENYSVNKNEL